MRGTPISKQSEVCDVIRFSFPAHHLLNDVQFHFDLDQKNMLLPKCHSMSLRIGEKTSFMFAGLSLSGNRAMFSFL